MQALTENDNERFDYKCVISVVLLKYHPELYARRPRRARRC
jgi:hypothetical protein